MGEHFIRTKLATDFAEGKSFGEIVIDKLLFFVPKGNPGYEKKLHLVKEWLVEFDKEGLPSREIGLDEEGNVVIAGPNEKDYGFWLDTNMEYKDFAGELIENELFETQWGESEVYRNS